MKLKKIQQASILVLIIFFASCSLDKNIVVKNEQGDYLIVSYGKSFRDSEKSAYASMLNKCGDSARLKSINTEYIGAFGETENKIATKVIDIVEQISYSKGVNLPVQVDNDENYRTELIFLCN